LAKCLLSLLLVRRAEAKIAYCRVQNFTQLHGNASAPTSSYK
jgi:hypothetical protein